jgi:hypothetical protein
VLAFPVNLCQLNPVLVDDLFERSDQRMTALRLDLIYELALFTIPSSADYERAV